MSEMERIAKEREAAYEQRRRTRILGLAIDQVIQGFKNIIVYSDPKFWSSEQHEGWFQVKALAENHFEDVLEIERRLKALADIYQSMIPANKELDMYREPPQE